MYYRFCYEATIRISYHGVSTLYMASPETAQATCQHKMTRTLSRICQARVITKKDHRTKPLWEHHRSKHFLAQAPRTATIFKLQDCNPAPQMHKTHETFTNLCNPSTSRKHQKPAHGHYFETPKLAMSISYETCAQPRNIHPSKPVHGHKSSKKDSGRERLVRDLSEKKPFTAIMASQKL